MSAREPWEEAAENWDEVMDLWEVVVERWDEVLERWEAALESWEEVAERWEAAWEEGGMVAGSKEGVLLVSVAWGVWFAGCCLCWAIVSREDEGSVVLIPPTHGQNSPIRSAFSTLDLVERTRKRIVWAPSGVMRLYPLDPNRLFPVMLLSDISFPFIPDLRV